MARSKSSTTGRLKRALAAARMRKSARQTAIKRRRFSVKRNKRNAILGLGFPKKITVTHKYHEQVNLTTGISGGTAANLFSCNSLFDPNTSGVGHQPLYFDQMSALYNHYTVIGSKIVVRVNKTTTDVIPTTVGIKINDDTSTTTNVNTLVEQSLTNHRLVSSGNPVVVLTNKWSAKKMFGGSILGNDNLQGSAGASPTEQSYFEIWANSEASATQTNVMCDVTITYIAVWDELKDISGS